MTDGNYIKLFFILSIIFFQLSSCPLFLEYIPMHSDEIFGHMPIEGSNGLMPQSKAIDIRPMSNINPGSHVKVAVLPYVVELTVTLACDSSPGGPQSIT